MRHYLKVINKKGKMVFRTQDLHFLSEKRAQEFLEEFRGCIKKGCEIYIHRVETLDGVKANKVKFFENETHK